jgi:tryptophan halogenase
MTAVREERAIRSVCVAGGGIVGLSAALAFARALPQARVIVVELPVDPAALADRMPSTLPPVGRFHAAIGFDEPALVREEIALHRMATRFEHWSADGEPWHHAFGGIAGSVGGAPLYKAWTRARGDGRAARYDRHNVAAVLGAAGKFVHPDGRPGSQLSGFLYALRLDPDRYRDRLAAACAAQGIGRESGVLQGIERREDGGVAALMLDGGRSIEADLFLDCAGPSAPVLSALGSTFEDWSAWHPCDRLLLGESGGNAPSPLDLVEAQPDGWRGTLPLPKRTLTVAAFASAGADQARSGEAVTIRPGRRPTPWIGNVLAVGDAAVAVDPLHGLNLHLAQSAILRALELLPGRDCHPMEVAEHNRRAEQEALRVRDFIALHYLCSGRRGGAFWEELAGRTPPDTLALTLEQWERRGRLPFFEEESFDRDSWAAVLLGLGVMPRDADPVAAGVDPDEAAAALAHHAERLAALPAKLPSYSDYLARMSGER